MDLMFFDETVLLMTEFCASQTVETYSCFCCLNCQLTVDVRRDAHHELAAEMPGSDGLRNGFSVIRHVGNNFFNNLTNPI